MNVFEPIDQSLHKIFYALFALFALNAWIILHLNSSLKWNVCNRACSNVFDVIFYLLTESIFSKCFRIKILVCLMFDMVLDDFWWETQNFIKLSWQKFFFIYKICSFCQQITHYNVMSSTMKSVQLLVKLLTIYKFFKILCPIKSNKWCIRCERCIRCIRCIK